MSERVVETAAAGGLLRVRARALPLPAASAAALEVAAPVAVALRRAADSAAAAAEPVVQEQLDELREGVAAGADDAKVPFTRSSLANSLLSTARRACCPLHTQHAATSARMRANIGITAFRALASEVGIR